MYDDAKLQLARDLIRNLLAAGPMKGATLKLRMLRDFESESGQAFDAAFRIYPKFSSFLAANSDLVEVLRPAAGVPGDITVRLRVPVTDSVAGNRAERDAIQAPERYLPRDVWQAFTNPDPQRRRFFNRHTHQVAHFLKDQPMAGLANDHDWLEIQPAPAKDQAAWMREFALTEPLSASRRDTLLSIADLPYSATSNTLFNKTLAEFALVWRRYRASMVIKFVREWCQSVGVPFTDVSCPISGSLETTAAGSHDSASLRQVLIQAIQTAAPDELQRVMVPATFLLRRTRGDGS